MALGRGLESLIPQKKNGEEVSSPKEQTNFSVPAKSVVTTARQESVFYIELEKIKPNPYQPRKEFNETELNSLADSMKQYGMLQPLLVSKVELAVSSGTRVEYQLIAGERRLRAAGIAGLRQVPVIIKNPDNATRLEIALIENVQRQNLNAIEEALAYERLMTEFKLTQMQVAQKVGKSREVIANRVRLLDLPYEVQRSISDGKISEGHAKVLLAIKNSERQIFLTDEIIKKTLSVRELEDIVRQDESYKAKTARVSDPELENYKKTIQDTLGTPVSFSGSREKGKLAISFYSQEDLDRLIKKLTNQL
ncbi:MAG: ParB/RepB/Spo0J family partition protein [bacterium]|nr:ParB/RepB/Spo0J family partition protein [bacterium]